MKDLLRRRLVFVTGKGGVGKTTFSAALAAQAAARGKRVLVCEVDAVRPVLGTLFGKGSLDTDPIELEENLWACNLTADACMRRFLKRFVKAPRAVDYLLRQNIAWIFFRAAPSVMEAVIADEIGHQLSEPSRWDMMVVDLPASGHALTFLNVPKAMLKMVRMGRLAEHVRKLAALFADPNEAGVVLVTLPEEMPVNETLEFAGKMKEQTETPVLGVAVNGLRQVTLDAGNAEALERLQKENPESSEALRALRDAAILATYWGERDREGRQRIYDAFGDDWTEIPFVFKAADDRALLASVEDAIKEVL